MDLILRRQDTDIIDKQDPLANGRVTLFGESAGGWRALERSAGLSEPLSNAVNYCD